MHKMGTLKFYWIVGTFAAQEMQDFLIMFIAHGNTCGPRMILLHETNNNLARYTLTLLFNGSVPSFLHPSLNS